MKIILTFLFSILLFQSYFSQTAEELNIQSKELLQKQNYKEALPVLKQAASLDSGEA